MAALLLLQAAPPASDYLADLLRSLLAVAGVGLIAFFSLRYLQRRGFGAARGAGAAVRVIARVPLEPRKSLYLVRVGTRVLLIGVGDAGAPSLIAELDPASVDALAGGQANTTAPRESGGG